MTAKLFVILQVFMSISLRDKKNSTNLEIKNHLFITTLLII